MLIICNDNNTFSLPSCTHNPTILSSCGHFHLIAASGMFRQALWMKHFGHLCLKRTLLWSLSPAIRYLDLGPIRKGQHKSMVQTAIKYQDRSGKTRYKGAGATLKNTQFLVCNWLFKVFSSLFYSIQSLFRLYFGTLHTSNHLRVYPPKFVGKIMEMKDEFIKTSPTLPEVLLPILYCTCHVFVLYHVNQCHK